MNIQELKTKTSEHLINQAEEDKNFGIPFEEGPIQNRISTKKINLGNNWYEDAT